MADEAKTNEVSYNEAEIAEALAAEMGIEDPGAMDGDSETAGFFRSVREMSGEPADPKPEPAAEAPAQEWVHEPTGKSFDSEIELLRYESGWKDNKYGNELKETRAKLEAFEKLLDGAGNEPAQAQQVNPEEAEKIILRRALEGTGVNLDEVDPGAYKTIVKMMENMLGMYDGVASRRFDEIRGTVEKITTRAQEAEALNRAGISADQVSQALQKHPSLKALPPGERVAVIADLVKTQEAAKPAAPETGNALRQALQTQQASGHVEGSVGSAPPDDYDSHLEGELFKLPEKARLNAIAQLFERSDVGMRIKDAHI